MGHYKYSSIEEKNNLDAECCYDGFRNYIFENNARFIFDGTDKSVEIFFKKLDGILPKIKTTHKSGEMFYRARTVECLTGHYPSESEKFEAYSEEEFSAPPIEKARSGRINPEGVSYLYLSNSRRGALTEVRPNIAAIIAIATGCLNKDVTIASFAESPSHGETSFETALIELIGILLSRPLNGYNNIEYLPTQIISEYIKTKGFDGIEYKSSQHKGSTNLALFDPHIWKAESSKIFEVEDIEYVARYNPANVERFGYPDEEL